MLKKKLGKLMTLGLMIIMVFSLVGCKEKADDNAVVTIDGKSIGIEEFERDFNVYRKIYEQQLGEDALTQEIAEGVTVNDYLKQEVLNKIILQEIVEKDAEKRGIEYSDQEVEEKKKSYIEGFGGEEVFKDYLESNGIAEEDFENSLIFSDILIAKHRDSLMDEMEVPEKDAKKYFEENKDQLVKVRARHILVGEDEEAKAKEIIEKLNKGESFEDLAIKESKHPGSALEGGDLGYFLRGAWGEALKPFEDKAFEMEIGDISEPIKTELGYHIIKLEDKKDSFESLREDIENEIKVDMYIDEMGELRDKTKIEINDELLKSLGEEKEEIKEEVK